ncbi:MAG: hypothetical protein WCC17_12030, partial [Candidatus Nitrosopolaris sp.]
RKLRQRFIDYSAHNLHPIAHSEPDTNSHFTQIALQSSLAQKRKEMEYMDHESRKYDNSFIRLYNIWNNQFKGICK